MTRISFKMHLLPGFQLEYVARHNAIWPELKELLIQTGVLEYYIYLDEDNNDLFGIMKVIDGTTLNDLPNHPVMKKWWKYMSDIMETNPDLSPKQVQLKEVFCLM
ncbi:L-rhamnose mutarotase [Sphingobacteriaceae bacterium]|nr:L-rhamnose mutarotase [Sphingobacteriaceae bacterium]